MEREDVPTISDDDDELLGEFEEQDDDSEDLKRLENEGGEVEVGSGESG